MILALLRHSVLPHEAKICSRTLDGFARLLFSPWYHQLYKARRIVMKLRMEIPALHVYFVWQQIQYRSKDKFTKNMKATYCFCVTWRQRKQKICSCFLKSSIFAPIDLNLWTLIETTNNMYIPNKIFIQITNTFCHGIDYPHDTA